jgi:hypothetical protein
MKLMNDGDTTSACQTSDDFRRENTAAIWSLPIYTMRKRDRQQGSKATPSNRMCPPKTARQIRRLRDKKTQKGKRHKPIARNQKRRIPEWPIQGKLSCPQKPWPLRVHHLQVVSPSTNSGLGYALASEAASGTLKKDLGEDNENEEGG